MASNLRPKRLTLEGCCLLLAIASVSLVDCQPERFRFAARRAADDARPISRVGYLQQSESQTNPIVVGKFRAPAPERVARQRIPKSSEFGAQTIGASYRVAEASSQPEKTVHGVAGASTSQRESQSIAQVVGAKFQVSDEGLNYPPSKLSADIYGNVAEIVTAPPEAVEGDFLLPQSTRFQAANQKHRRSRQTQFGN